MAVPTFQVLVEWNTAATSTTDVAPFTSTYDDVSADVVGPIQVTRGRTDHLAQMASGTCSFSLFNPTAPDLYNPNATAAISAIVNTGGFVPLRPVRIQGTYSSTTYPIFTGYIRNISWDADTRHTTFQCEDLFLLLSRVYPTWTTDAVANFGTTGVINTATAITYALNQAGWTTAALIDVDPGGGDQITSFGPFDGSQNKSALSIIEDLVTAERGYFVATPEGVAKYRSRRDYLTQSVAATLTTNNVQVSSTQDLDKIVNQAVVTSSANGAAPQIKNDAPSQALYGINGINISGNPYIVGDTQAAGLADYLVYNGKNSVSPVTVTIDNGATADITKQLTLDVGSRITVQPTIASSTKDFIIEQVSWTIEEGGLYSQTSYLCSVRGTASLFTIGTTHPPASLFDSATDLLFY